MGLRWGARLVFGTLIVVITDFALMPGAATPPVLFGTDKVQHVLAFFTLALVMRLGWPRQPMAVLVIGLFAYGVAIEVAQAQDFIGRTASFADMMANMIGLSLGFLAGPVLRWIQR